MTILISGGDSFTYGSELKDCDATRQFSMNSWSALLAQHLGMNYSCTALPGASNGSIARRVMKACEKTKHTYDIVVAVMWTFNNRYEFCFSEPTGERDSPWYTITPWTHETNLSRISNSFANLNNIHLEHHKQHSQKMSMRGISKFSKNYYATVGNELWECYTTYKDILFLQQYLQSNNIPYIFTHVEPIFKEQTSHGDLDVLINQIDKQKFYLFDGFYRWASENNYEIGSTHPLEPAHIDFADKLFLHCKANNIL